MAFIKCLYSISTENMFAL